MSEVDRLSNSGLFPALPIADRRSSKNPRPGKPASNSVDTPESSGTPPPKSHIDEYA
jgi:hypothetical protein